MFQEVHLAPPNASLPPPARQKRKRPSPPSDIEEDGDLNHMEEEGEDDHVEDSDADQDSHVEEDGPRTWPAYTKLCLTDKGLLSLTRSHQELVDFVHAGFDAIVKYLWTINSYPDRTSVTKRNFNKLVRKDAARAVEDNVFAKRMTLDRFWCGVVMKAVRHYWLWMNTY